MKKDRFEVLTQTVKHLFNTIGLEDILHTNANGETIFEDRPLNPAEVKMLREEAKLFYNSKLWKVLQRDIKWNANKIMFIESKNEFDLAVGKMLLYYNNIINSRLEKLTKGK